MELLFFVLLVGCAVKCEESNYYVVQRPLEDTPLTDTRHLKVYWNVPTMQCSSKKIYFDHLFEKYGITQNSNDSFRGEHIAILYDPGFFPALLRNESSGALRYRNGGVPQEGNLDLHLKSFKSVLDQSVPDKEFSGLGIIDFESWRPVFRQNFGEVLPYKSVSYDIERKKHFWWPQPWIAAEAKRRFEESAQLFMQSTISLAKKMRPKARWGYYGFPYCFNMVNNNMHEGCAKNVHAENDHIDWLWMESSALYPSVYSSKSLTTEQLSALITGRVLEATRVRKNDAPILPYFWFRYRDGGFLTQKDLEAALQIFNDTRASGFLIWGSSNDVNTVDKCKNLLKYVKEVMGPAVAIYTKQPKRSNDEDITTTDEVEPETTEQKINETIGFDDLNINDTDLVISEDKIESKLFETVTDTTENINTEVPFKNTKDTDVKKYIVANIDEDYVENPETSTISTTIKRHILDDVVEETATKISETNVTSTHETSVEEPTFAELIRKSSFFRNEVVEEQTDSPMEVASINSRRVPTVFAKFDEVLELTKKSRLNNGSGVGVDNFFLDDNDYYDENLTPSAIKRNNLVNTTKSVETGANDNQQVMSTLQPFYNIEGSRKKKLRPLKRTTTTTMTTEETTVTYATEHTTTTMAPVTDFTHVYDFENLLIPNDELRFKAPQKEFKVPHIERLKYGRRKENDRGNDKISDKMAMEEKFPTVQKELSAKESAQNLTELFKETSLTSYRRRKPQQQFITKNTTSSNTDSIQSYDFQKLANISKLYFPEIELDFKQSRENIMSVRSTTYKNIPENNITIQSEADNEMINEMLTNTHIDPVVERLIRFVYQRNQSNGSSTGATNLTNVLAQRFRRNSTEISTTTSRPGCFEPITAPPLKPLDLFESDDSFNETSSNDSIVFDTIVKPELNLEQSEFIDKSDLKDILRVVRAENKTDEKPEKTQEEMHEKTQNDRPDRKQEEQQDEMQSEIQTTEQQDEMQERQNESQTEKGEKEVNYKGKFLLLTDLPAGTIETTQSNYRLYETDTAQITTESNPYTTSPATIEEQEYSITRTIPYQHVAETTTEDKVGGSAHISRPKYIFCIIFYFYSVSKCLCEFYGNCT